MKKLGVGLAVAAGAAVLGFGYYMYGMQSAGSGALEPQTLGVQAMSAAPSGTTPLKPHRTPPEGQHEYYNEHYRFALFYPSNLIVSNFDEGGGAMSLSFQNVKAGQGFQIFVVPYNASQVTPAQFKKDEPSGVRQGAHDVMIDGATAASFYSTDTALGETAEIWFIHGGYLFEVTTLKPLAAWLSEIMSTWQFI